MRRTNSRTAVAEALRRHALTFPETREDHPWGETAIKVKGKAFLFMGSHDGELSFSVKLPQSRDLALDLPGTEPTHYGLGKHGWVTVTLEKGSELPLDLLKSWVTESYRAIAPKKILDTLPGAAAPRKPARRRAIQRG